MATNARTRRPVMPIVTSSILEAFVAASLLAALYLLPKDRRTR